MSEFLQTAEKKSREFHHVDSQLRNSIRVDYSQLIK